jgi:ATP-dependent HslUV protease subunit HslV
MADDRFPGWHGTTIIGVRRGGRVVVADLNVEGADRVANEIGGEAVEHDVRDLGSWERLLAAAQSLKSLLPQLPEPHFRAAVTQRAHSETEAGV